ncbi:MAG TPA: type II toxin-antitoxin system RelE/ParE family toxin, partial [Burkholderiaceae bacterium]|nr:type II toxin-antitoxin system RelE/ParE family toxin [Burkholderiaceae bacterium]
MSFTLVFKPLATAEIEEAYSWYSQAEIGKGAEFLNELARIEYFIRLNPLLYPRVEAEIRRAGLRRFPYSLFYVVEGGTV